MKISYEQMLARSSTLGNIKVGDTVKEVYCLDAERGEHLGTIATITHMTNTTPCYVTVSGAAYGNASRFLGRFEKVKTAADMTYEELLAASKTQPAFSNGDIVRALTDYRPCDIKRGDVFVACGVHASSTGTWHVSTSPNMGGMLAARCELVEKLNVAAPVVVPKKKKNEFSFRFNPTHSAFTMALRAEQIAQRMVNELPESLVERIGTEITKRLQQTRPGLNE